MDKEQTDTEFTLMVSPHHCYSYVIQAFSGDDGSGEHTVLLKQTGFTSFQEMSTGVNTDKEHELKRLDISWLQDLEETVRTLSIPVVAEDPACGLGGVDYKLRIDPGEGAAIEFEWWKRLPEHWLALEPIVSALNKEFG